MNWQQFVMQLAQLDPQRVEAALTRLGALSVTLTDAGDDPVLEPAPGETPLWGTTLVTALFPADTDLGGLPATLARELGCDDLPEHHVEPLADRDWAREWMKDFSAMRFGERLWICPGGAAAPAGAVFVRLDPGLAFGSGTHATTALCLEWLDGRRLDGKRLLDYGCGSGVLAIAALKLGAASATAFDIDPQALVATRRNAEENGVSARLEIEDTAESVGRGFDVVVANILEKPLISLAESLTTRLSSGGELALSGILSEQVNKIRAAYGRWIEFDAPVRRVQGGQEWALLKGKRRNG